MHLKTVELSIVMLPVWPFIIQHSNTMSLKSMGQLYVGKSMLLEVADIITLSLETMQELPVLL